MRCYIIYCKTIDMEFPALVYSIPGPTKHCWDWCVCVCSCRSCITVPRNALISPISAIPNQVKVAHGTEEGNSTHNGNISAPVLCVAFLRLIRSKYLTWGASVLALPVWSICSFFSAYANLEHRWHKTQVACSLSSIFISSNRPMILCFFSHFYFHFSKASCPIITAGLSVMPGL